MSLLDELVQEERRFFEMLSGENRERVRKCISRSNYFISFDFDGKLGVSEQVRSSKSTLALRYLIIQPWDIEGRFMKSINVGGTTLFARNVWTPFSQFRNRVAGAFEADITVKPDVLIELVVENFSKTTIPFVARLGCERLDRLEPIG